MAEATKKAEGIESLLSEITGKDRVGTIKNDKCVMCGGDASEFKDELSKKEYRISGMCQKCQDDFFG